MIKSEIALTLWRLSIKPDDKDIKLTRTKELIKIVTHPYVVRLTNSNAIRMLRESKLGNTISVWGIVIGLSNGNVLYISTIFGGSWSLDIKNCIMIKTQDAKTMFGEFKHTKKWLRNENRVGSANQMLSSLHDIGLKSISITDFKVDSSIA